MANILKTIFGKQQSTLQVNIKIEGQDKLINLDSGMHEQQAKNMVNKIAGSLPKIIRTDEDADGNWVIGQNEHGHIVTIQSHKGGNEEYEIYEKL
jgi:hypothetical protein